MLLDWCYYGLEVSVQTAWSILGSKPSEDRTACPPGTACAPSGTKSLLLATVRVGNSPFLGLLTRTTVRSNDLTPRIWRCHHRILCFHCLFHVCFPQEQERPGHDSFVYFQNLEPWWTGCSRNTGCGTERVWAWRVESNLTSSPRDPLPIAASQAWRDFSSLILLRISSAG